MEREIEMRSALYSIEDSHDDKPSLKVDIDGRMIRIETIYGNTSLFIEDFEQVVAELEKFRRTSSLVQGEAA